MNDVADLAHAWTRLWNGDLDQIDRIVAPDIPVHAAIMGSPGADGLRGREALGGWITGMRATVDDLTFTVEVGPITEADYLVLRWRARGTYRGGWPGVPDEAAGRAIDFTGTDILRMAGDVFAEYWVNSDTLLLFQQLGVVPSA